ncbi:MAG: YihY/virulence factor BrkB family protein [Prevotella sp.]
MKLRPLLNYLKDDIWLIQPEEVSAWRMFWIELYKKLVLSIRFFTAKRVVNEAAALTYSTLLAIVPILAVVFAIARGFGYNKYIEIWFLDAFKSQPQAAEVIVGFVNSYLLHTKSGVFIGFGLVFMLYTVLVLVSNVERTFNGIWHVKKPRSIFRTFTDYLAMVLLCPILIVITSGLSLFMATVAGKLSSLELLAPALRLLIDLFPYVLMSMMFIGLYVFMPNTHVRVRHCVVPGILAGVAMQWLQLFYIHSQIWVSSYNAIYGSFAALPMFMLWVQISWTICLFGAELCYTNQNLDFYDYGTDTSDVSYRYRMVLCVLIMRTVCRRFDRGQRPCSAADLREETSIPVRIVNDLAYQLVEAGLLAEVSADEKGEVARYMPAVSLEHLSVGMMVDRLEAIGRWRLSLPLEKLHSEAWHTILRTRTGYLGSLRQVLLKDV